MVYSSGSDVCLHNNISGEMNVDSNGCLVIEHGMAWLERDLKDH